MKLDPCLKAVVRNANIVATRDSDVSLPVNERDLAIVTILLSAVASVLTWEQRVRIAEIVANQVNE